MVPEEIKKACLELDTTALESSQALQPYSNVSTPSSVASTSTPNHLESSLWQKATTARNSEASVLGRYSLLDSKYEIIQEKETSDIFEQAEALALVLEWIDIEGKSTINIMITTPKPFLYKFVTPGTNYESSNYFFTQAKAVIDEIGPSKFVAVITESTNDMITMWSMEKYGKNRKKLKLPNQSQAVSYIIMMETLVCNREALEATVVCLDFNFNKEIKKYLLSDELWAKITAYYNILKPIYVATTKLESDKALLSDVPEIFEFIRENMCNSLNACTTLSQEEENFILDAIEKWQNIAEKPIHFAANILDPKYRGLKLSSEKIAKGQEFIHQFAELHHMNPGKVMANLAEYRAKSGFYSQAGIWSAADQVEARTWWKGLCACQIISSIATKLLSVPASSNFSEHNWSLIGDNLVNPRKRKRNTGTDRLQKIKTVRANKKLLYADQNKNMHQSDVEYNNNSSSEDEEKEQKCGLHDFSVNTESEMSDNHDPLV
ncbi:hypothetical protein ABMA28_005808 [Loxostege sticticalis]|uniref:HAT C-terminal dimerisation domain-containing protein n=1 Tax=Loxostege sticticalis TaxID=481309 RepID=A0ABD0SMX7_LOXSC